MVLVFEETYGNHFDIHLKSYINQGDFKRFTTTDKEAVRVFESLKSNKSHILVHEWTYPIW